VTIERYAIAVCPIAPAKACGMLAVCTTAAVQFPHHLAVCPAVCLRYAIAFVRSYDRHTRKRCASRVCRKTALRSHYTPIYARLLRVKATTKPLYCAAAPHHQRQPLHRFGFPTRMVGRIKYTSPPRGLLLRYAVAVCSESSHIMPCVAHKSK